MRLLRRPGWKQMHRLNTVTSSRAPAVAKHVYSITLDQFRIHFFSYA